MKDWSSSENDSQGSTIIASSQDGQEDVASGKEKKGYVRRSLFMKGNKPKQALKGPKMVNPERIEEKDLTFDILYLVGCSNRNPSS